MPSECLKEGHCKALQTTFFECKRSMVSQCVDAASGSERWEEYKKTGDLIFPFLYKREQKMGMFWKITDDDI